MKISGIYKIQSILKPERCYIGSAVYIKKRWNEHLKGLRFNRHENKKLQRHYDKYSEADLVFVILEPCFPEFLLIREQFYLDTLNPYFNICKVAGSQLGCKRSKETCLKMGKWQEGRIFTEEHKENIGKAGKGRIPWNKGLKMSKEHCKKLSESHIDQIPWNKGTTGYVSFTKPILQYDKEMNFIKEWKSATEAARAISISFQIISRVANDKSRSAGGFIWKFKNIA